jgi:hypothetical protein
MEHSVHLAARHFISHLGPATSSTIMKKVRAVLQTVNKGKDQGTIDLDRLDSDFVATFNGDGNDNEATDDEFDVADAVGKALALVKQVSQS